MGTSVAEMEAKRRIVANYRVYAIKLSYRQIAVRLGVSRSYVWSVFALREKPSKRILSAMALDMLLAGYCSKCQMRKEQDDERQRNQALENFYRTNV